MTYLKDKYLEPVVEMRTFKDTFNDTYYRRATTPKIIIKGLTLLDAALDLEGQLVPGKSTLIMKSSNLDTLKFVAGVLNSDVAIAYLKEKYSASSYNGGIVFSKDMLNNFPLPTVSTSQKKLVVRLVNKILSVRGQKPDVNITEVQKDINALVHQIYQLSKDDIRALASP